jgi:hypothetical protein
MHGLSFGRTVIVLVGINLLTVSSKILRKLEYTSLILSELNTILSQFVIFMRKAKDEYKNKLTSELLNKDIPPGKWWEIAKSISNFTKARDPPSFLEHDCQICIHPSDKAEILNTHFSNIAKFLYSSLAFLTKSITSFVFSPKIFQSSGLFVVLTL